MHYQEIMTRTDEVERLKTVIEGLQPGTCAQQQQLAPRPPPSEQHAPETGHSTSDDGRAHHEATYKTLHHHAGCSLVHDHVLLTMGFFTLTTSIHSLCNPFKGNHCVQCGVFRKIKWHPVDTLRYKPEDTRIFISFLFIFEDGVHLLQNMRQVPWLPTQRNKKVQNRG
eukprot:364242-Chlamydomonas_euryale.AAC.5